MGMRSIMLTVTRVYRDPREKVEFAEVKTEQGVTKTISRAEIKDADDIDEGDELPYRVNIMERLIDAKAEKYR
jgi:hypothetical protein